MSDERSVTAQDTPVPEGSDVLGRLGASLGVAEPGRHAPVDRWNPPYCGEINLRIGADGQWFYNGSAIMRPALVKLFASVLRRDPDRFVLVTPVERVGITVEDAPFLAVEMAREGEGEARRIVFRTNVDDAVAVGPENPLRFEEDATGAVKPYVLVRGGLWALATRALTYDLIDLADEAEVDGRTTLSLAVAGTRYPIPTPPGTGAP